MISIFQAISPYQMEARRYTNRDSDIADWSITCVDTGLGSNIGQRLKAVQKYVEDEEYFLANYSDVLTDLPAARND